MKSIEDLIKHFVATAKDVPTVEVTYTTDVIHDYSKEYVTHEIVGCNIEVVDFEGNTASFYLKGE